MTIYAIVDSDGNFVKTVDDSQGNVCWNATNFCIPSALTPAQMAEFCVQPYLEVSTPTINWVTQSVAPAPPILVNAVWTQQWIVTSLPLATVQANLINQLEPQRAAQQAKGLSYAFSDGRGIIQLRNDGDKVNINGYTSMAMIAAQQGAAAMPMGFKDEANAWHAMTPAQAMAMGVAVGAFVGNLITAKDAIAASINALTTVEAAQAFDLTQGWPT